MAASIKELCDLQTKDDGRKDMKIMICTAKIRPDGIISIFPPLGAMAISQCLIKAGYENSMLYDIDSFRPSDEVIKQKLKEEAPVVIGISGVVSTAYEYIKNLIVLIHEVLPETVIVVGGNIAASSEILLRLAGADYCVISEGELAIIELMNYIKDVRPKRSMPDDHDKLRAIKGLSFLDEKNVAAFTGYQKNIPAEELYNIDYDFLEKYSDINAYIINPFHYHHFAYDRRSYLPHRIGKKLGTLVTTKGCVAKCTFCHRWDHSIRFIPVDIIIERIKVLMERYNVGFISFSDENWGSWGKWNEEFVEKIKPLDILWRVGGVRTRSVSLELLKKMKDAGCSNVQYGMETGSQKILDVMEKNAKLSDNINAAYWTHQADIYTTYSIVLGMPGESPETVKETAAFLSEVTGFLPEEPYGRLSINRLQALPGTPAYEMAKQKGWIGRTPEEEEKYLLYVSDLSCAIFSKQLNFTDFPDYVVQSWRRILWLEVMHNWFMKHPEKIIPLWKVIISAFSTFFRSAEFRLKIRRKEVEADRPMDGDEIDSLVDKNWNAHRDIIQESMINVRYHPALYAIRHFAVLEVVVREFFNFQESKKFWLKSTLALPKYYYQAITGKFKKGDYRSLRKIVAETRPEPLTESEKNLLPLQLGR